MCGICGVVQLRGEARPVLEPGRLDLMTDMMTHRGPDDRGTYVADGVALGVRRLSIVDVDGGHQPFANEDETIWAVQNGELYNHASIRTRLERDGHRFHSRCDTEILPHLYEQYGPGFPEQLHGMFGLAVWDARRRQAVIARDRLGIKPLYYAVVGDLLVFASELKSLLASGLVDRTLDYEAIDAYLSFGLVPGPRTPLAGVQKLLPGHTLVVGGGRVDLRPYWEYPEPRTVEMTAAEHGAELMELLEQAVRDRLMSDVPIGAMLSGGLDSSLIVALMARNSSGPVKTFSIGFREDTDANELSDARSVAQLFGTEHHELELSYDEQAIDVADLVWFLDEPLADLSALGFLALCELASRHVTVALSGQGADELLGGYLKHRAAAFCRHWDRLPTPVRSASASVLTPLARGRFRRSARTLFAADPADRLVAMSGKLDPARRVEFLRGPLAQADGLAARRAVLRLADVPAGTDALAATLHLDAQFALVDEMLHYFDRTSMAHSLEVRVPFLDHRVVEACARIPSSLKVRRQTTKFILKEVARDVLPDAIVDKRKIGFFRDATSSWLRSQVDHSLATYLLDSSPAYADFLDRGAVERLVRERQAGRGLREQHLLLAILMLEVWLSTYLPAIPAAPRTENRGDAEQGAQARRAATSVAS